MAPLFTALLLVLGLIQPSLSWAVSTFDQEALTAGLKISSEINDPYDVMDKASNLNDFDAAFHSIGEVIARPNLTKSEKAFLCSALLSRTNPELAQIEILLIRPSASVNLAKCISEIKFRLDQEHLRINIADNVVNSYVPRLNIRKQKFPNQPGMYTTQNINAKEVILTFDDGPNPRTTPAVLDILDRAGIKAIFFSVGENAQDHPNLAKEIITRGHGLGSHSFFHTLMLGCKMRNGIISQNYALSEMIKGHAGVLNAAGTIDPFARFPDGDRTKVLTKNLNEMGLSEFFWAIDTEDWRNSKDKNGVPRAKAILKQFIRELELTKQNTNKDRGIILMHDIWGQTIEALPLILSYLKDNGYTFVLPTSDLRSDIRTSKNIPNYYEAVSRSIHNDRRKAVNVFSFNPTLTVETRARSIYDLASSAEFEWNVPSSGCSASSTPAQGTILSPAAPISTPTTPPPTVVVEPPQVIDQGPEEIAPADDAASEPVVSQPTTSPDPKKKKRKGFFRRIFG